MKRLLEPQLNVSLRRRHLELWRRGFAWRRSACGHSYSREVGR